MLPRQNLLAVLLLPLVALIRHGYAFTFTPLTRYGATHSNQIPLHMIKNPFSPSSSDSNTGDFPRDVKDAVSRCRASVQEALSKRISRMDVEMPVGAKFGIEKTKKNKKANMVAGDVETSDRELARIFVEMFQPLGSNAISVCFNEESQAEAARKQWKGDPSAASRICSFGGRQKRKKTKQRGGGMGFAAKLNDAVEDEEKASRTSGPFKLPENSELALFVAPGPKELVTIERICGEVGMGTLVVLLNARLTEATDFASDGAKKLFLEEFEPVFSLCAADQEAAPGCLLHRSHPGDWMMARKPKVGPPKVVFTTKTRPGSAMCAEAYENMEIGDVEEAVENALDNIANWFR